MLTGLSAHVQGSNRLTARWCAAAGTDDFAVAGCGVWPLLAILAATAAEPARSELAGAIGIPATDAHAAGLDLLRTLAESKTVTTALGVWIHRDLPLHEDWLAALPAGTADLITDQAALDAWARRHTAGLIEKFPLDLTPGTLMLLATALLAETEWRQRFSEEGMLVTDGPWRGHEGPALVRRASGAEYISVLAGLDAVTRVVVEGNSDLDVHLLLSEGSPADTLATGIAALDGSVAVHTELPEDNPGPGLFVSRVRNWSEEDVSEVWVPPFETHSSHDLLKHAEVFGLDSALDSTRGHFPGISPMPLCVSRAAQDIRARFSATGFQAAAVTVFGVAPGCAEPQRPPYLVRKTTAVFDRPFGYLAVHRPTGLVVVAGWVARAPTTREYLLGRLCRGLHRLYSTRDGFDQP
ncbi:serpin family protein [Nocardia sp. NPDC003693]